jgi:hypothetical protein
MKPNFNVILDHKNQYWSIPPATQDPKHIFKGLREICGADYKKPRANEHQ